MSVERVPLLLAFGTQVSKRRRDRGMTQEDLAAITGLHRTYIGSVERGERNPTLTTLAALAEGLACSLPDLTSQIVHGVSAQ